MAGEKEWFNLNNWQPAFLEELLGLKIRVYGEDLCFFSALGQEWVIFIKICLLITFEEKRTRKEVLQKKRLLTLDFLIIY